MLEYGFSLTRIFPLSIPPEKIKKPLGFLMFLGDINNGEVQVRENPYSGIFYAVRTTSFYEKQQNKLDYGNTHWSKNFPKFMIFLFNIFSKKSFMISVVSTEQKLDFTIYLIKSAIRLKRNKKVK